MRCTCGIDTHAHVVPENFPPYIGSKLPGDWPSMASAQACHRHVMISGKVYRTVSDKCWDTAKRLADLAQMNLSLQVISPMPELLSYWMQPSDAQQLLRFLNDQIASMVLESGGRLAGLGAVPLQDVDKAISELEYVVKVLGFPGVEIGSTINGLSLGDPQFEPFFAACEALGAAVFVHAIRPASPQPLLGPAPLLQVLSYPSEVGLAAASVITHNLLVRHPLLRMAFSHGGGTLGLLLPRLEQGWRVFPALEASVIEAPRLQARKLFFDTLVFDTPALRYLVDTFGSTQLMVGTDYPFNFHEHNPLERIETAAFDDLTRRQLTHLNAERFLGMTATPP